MNNYLTQKQQVLDHLNTHGSITSWEAIKIYGITRVSEYIFSMRDKDKLKIESIYEKNEHTHWVRYKMFTADSNGQERFC